MTTTSDRGPADERAGLLARMALVFTAWSERWLPDAFIFALIGTAVVIVAALTVTEATVTQVVDAWGEGFWELIQARGARCDGIHLHCFHRPDTGRAAAPDHPRHDALVSAVRRLMTNGAGQPRYAGH